MKQAVQERLTRRCEECGHYDCECEPSYSDCGYSSGGGKGYTTSSRSYSHGGDECCDYPSTASRGKSQAGGSYVVVKSGSASRSDYGDVDCNEYSGSSGSRKGSGGGGYVECHGGEREVIEVRGGGGYVECPNEEREVIQGSGGGCYEKEYVKGSYNGGQKCVTGSSTGRCGPSSKKIKCKSGC